KANCLSFTELLAQGVALISPTMTAALIIPVMFGNTGNWSWCSYALGTLMLLFVALNLNQFARRSTGSGSMYAYICRGLGISAGAIGGWSLLWAYMGIATAGVTGFTIFAGKLLTMAGIDAPPLLLSAICVAAAWFCAWKNVQLSAIMMLACEGLSMLLILALCLIVLGQHHFALDTAQFDTSTFPAANLGLGVVVAIFSLVGFECATAFGDEAKDPLKTIPRAVIMSLLISGAFFVFVTYTMVMGVRGYSTTLDKIDAPLNVLAVLAHVGVLQAPLSLGAMISFFALCLSCINAGGRVLYIMGRHGIVPPVTATSHTKNETPHVAVSLMAGIAMLIAVGGVLGHIATLDLFNFAGTCAAFGFIVPYALITVAAPVYLRAIGQLKAGDIVVCVASLLLLAIPAVGSVYPVPAAPVNAFPYWFLAYLAVGLAWILVLHRRRPTAADSIRDDLRMSHDRFAGEVEGVAPR
ncbi:MAG: APC family permease, partial [Caulobacteraceae bacterium]|nr:APC family permease [Caulobacteraceae bacterium]